MNNILEGLHINEAPSIAKNKKEALDIIYDLCQRYKIYPRDIQAFMDSKDDGYLGNNIKVYLLHDLKDGLPIGLSPNFEDGMIDALKKTKKDEKSILKTVQKYAAYPISLYKSNLKDIIFTYKDWLKEDYYLRIIY
jgi:hypothetical protein